MSFKIKWRALPLNQTADISISTFVIDRKSWTQICSAEVGHIVHLILKHVYIV